MVKGAVLVGILAFHGDVAEHKQVLDALNVQSREVRTVDELQHVTHLIIPGGESTVMSRFLKTSGMDRVIQERVKKGTLAVFGTCAGAILLAREATGKHAPKTLNLIDIVVDRNAYGSQLDSFEATINIKGIKKSLPVAFIRAPIIKEISKEVEVLATYQQHPILVRQGKILASTFHPEMRGQSAVHKLLLQL